MKNMAQKKDLSHFRKILREKLPALLDQYGVRSLSLFGSRVRGNESEGSDLDVLVEFEETPGLLAFIELENHLSKTLGVRVDLVMKEALKPRIGARILNEQVPV